VKEAAEARGALVIALLRATLIAVIFVSERLVDARRLDGTAFWIVLGCAIVYAAACLATALGAPGRRLLAPLQPGLDVLLIAVVAFTFQAVVHAGHLAGSANSWQRVMLSQDLYLVWSGAAATVLAVALNRRSARIESLAASRQQLVTHAIDAVERERTRLAGALHDEPVQSLIAARHDLRRAERTGDAESFTRLHEALDVTIADLREEIFNLHPHVLDHVGFGAAIEQVAQRHARDLGVRVEVAVDPQVPHELRQVLFSLGRELLGNAARHARAGVIGLTVDRVPEAITLVVFDDGDGIPEGRLHAALLEGHIGLAEIRERVAALNGTLAIKTGPGAGTRIAVTLPASAVESSPLTETPDRVTRVDPVSVSTG